MSLKKLIYCQDHGSVMSVISSKFRAGGVDYYHQCPDCVKKDVYRYNMKAIRKRG